MHSSIDWGFLRPSCRSVISELMGGATDYTSNGVMLINAARMLTCAAMHLESAQGTMMQSPDAMKRAVRMLLWEHQAQHVTPVVLCSTRQHKLWPRDL